MIPIPDRLTLKLVAGIGCVLLLALLVHDRNRWKAKSAQVAELLAGERAVHAATLANIRAATEQARRADAANAERIRAEQAVIDERTKNDFESRIAAARAAAGRLHTQGAAAHSGDRGATPVPGLSAAAEGIAETAGDNRFPPADRLTATEQAIQLDELIKWVRSQAQVEPGD